MSTDAMRAALEALLDAHARNTLFSGAGHWEQARAALAQPTERDQYVAELRRLREIVDTLRSSGDAVRAALAQTVSAERVPLTDEQIDGICERAWNEAETETAAHGTETDGRDWSPETEWTRYGEKIARAIERAHGIKSEVE